MMPGLYRCYPPATSSGDDWNGGSFLQLFLEITLAAGIAL